MEARDSHIPSEDKLCLLFQIPVADIACKVARSSPAASRRFAALGYSTLPSLLEHTFKGGTIVWQEYGIWIQPHLHHDPFIDFNNVYSERQPTVVR